MLQDKLSKGADVLIKTAAIAAAVTALGAGYVFVLNFVYKPSVEVLEVDFIKGTARIKVKGLFSKIITIDGDTIYGIIGDWGIRFGTLVVEGKTTYNRIELVRKQMVVEYLNKKL
jgi:hypothetical protein